VDDDRAQITRLIHEYAFLIDNGDLEGFAHLFSRGTWMVLGDPSGGDTGAPAVLSRLRENIHLYDGRPGTSHLTTNVVVEVADDRRRASARCYVTVLQSVPPLFPLQTIFSGYYDDRFERDENGWYFTTRAIRPDLVGDLSHHRRDVITTS
jgi:hypothetical protein